MCSLTRSLPRHVRRHSQPRLGLLRPAIGMSPGGLLAVRIGVARCRMDDWEIPHNTDDDLVCPEGADGSRPRRLLQEGLAIDQRLVAIGAVELRRQYFV